MFNTIRVSYKSTNRPYQANKFLAEISKHPIIAWDLEVASKYTDSQLVALQNIIDNPLTPKLELIKAKSKLKSTALDHPSHCTITHCSIAISESVGYVFIIDNPAILNLVFHYLTTTTQTQVLHNASYDFKHIYYHTGKFPINYEDTQILAKTLVNHVDITQALTGLKQLAGKWYGNWGISVDNFTIEQMYEPHVLLYSATDSCATFKLWEFTNEQCALLDTQIKEEFCEKYDCDPPPDWM